MGAYDDITPPDSGRKFYREPDERPDGRPVIRREQFWASAEEEGAYTAAVRNNPREVDLEAGTIESPLAYIQRLAQLAAKHPLVKPGRRFPKRPKLAHEYTGPREPVTENGLTFEDRTDAIYERSPGEEG
jgi:hypothetical protein